MLAPSLVDAIDAVIEANAVYRKRRALAKPERHLATAMRHAFLSEGRAFLSRFAVLEPRFPPAVKEAVSSADWGPLFDGAALETLNAYQAPLDAFTAAALQAGITAAIADVGIETSFDLANPRAVDYLAQQGARRVTGIQETTRTRLRMLLTQAADEGWSYGQTAKSIRQMYANMSTERARNIAIFELGDAYEHGNMLVAKDLQSAGLTMEKAWLTAGDNRVRPAHQSNGGDGWIPLDQAFSSGHDRPPTDPRCRCSLQVRRKQDG